jgi:hypothetical protein
MVQYDLVKDRDGVVILVFPYSGRHPREWQF